MVVVGFAIGLISLTMTAGHIGNPSYLLIAEAGEGATHAWYHALRELCGDIMTMVVILIVLFGKSSNRTPLTWLLSLLLMLGYYAPFWIGTPFLGQLEAPNIGAEVVHVTMAALALGGLAFLRKEFNGGLSDV
ncbi:MAG TPA: hypothetical protein DE179_04375 [Oceanospirillaceae bacterium]|nr:hypothetical protein [Oceanospirillaceae bacterium]